MSQQMMCAHSQYYTKCFDVFKRKSTERVTNLTAFEKTLPDVIKYNWVELQIPSIFKILSVGSGDGAGGDLVICDIIKTFLAVSSQKPTIFHQAVEPRADSLAIFRGYTDSWANDNCEIESCFRWFTGTWEEYQTKTKQEPEKFHLIHFLHSMYYLNIEDTLRDCVTNRLAEGGLIFCLLGNIENPLARFQKEFDFGFLSTPSNEAVVSAAKKNGWRYECFNFPFNIDVTEVFDESSVEGNLLLDFFTLTKNYRAVTEKSKVQKVEKFWLDASQACDDGKRQSTGPVSAVIIYKP